MELVTLLPAVVGVLLSQLASLLGSEVKLHWNFNDHLEYMKEKLENIQGELLTAEKRFNTKNMLDEKWLKKIQEVAYDLEDMLNDFLVNHHGSLKYKVRNILFKNRFVMAHKIKNIRHKLDLILKDKKELSIVDKEKDPDLDQEITNRSSMSAIEPHIFGRNAEKETIVEMLLNDAEAPESIGFIPIVGIGGIGKTTLAQLVFHDNIVNEHFNGQVFWAYVSLKPKLEVVMQRILGSVTNKQYINLDKEFLRKQLQLKLSNKKFLIVLDDAWSDDSNFWTELKLVLNYGRPESKVIVTTRNPSVAKTCGTLETVQLDPLSEEECRSIFRIKAFKKEEDKALHGGQLLTIGDEIARKCRGIPLAANYLGAQLKGITNVDDWKMVRDKEIYEFHLTSEPKEYKEARKILSSLWLSYFIMSPVLKVCFAYCSIFPKGYAIDKTKLVQQWISMGFIQPTENNQNGDDYVENLKSMAFFVENDLENEGQTYKMQDLVHSLARLAAGDRVATSNLQNGKEYHYVTLMGCNGDRLSKTVCKSLKRARALQFRECVNGELINQIFSSIERLRVLDLSGIAELKQLPNSLEK